MPGPSGVPALVHASRLGAAGAVAAAGASVNLLNTLCKIPLLRMATNGFTAVVQALLRAGANRQPGATRPPGLGHDA